MKEYFTIEGGKPLVVGKPFSYTVKEGNTVFTIVTSALSQEILDELIKKGHVRVVEARQEQDIKYYINKIINKYHLYQDTYNNLLTKSPVLILSMLLSEIALEMDRKYPNHISESPHIYGFSLAAGRITEIPKNTIRGYKFAAFRSMEDAKQACHMLKELIRMIYNGSK